MEPAHHLDISKQNVSSPREDDVQPLSMLAADKPEQHAKHYAFTDEDRELLDQVLAFDDDADPSAA